MKFKTSFVIIGMLLVVAASVIYYLLAYKVQTLVKAGLISLAFIGWYIAIYEAYVQYEPKSGRRASGSKRKNSIKTIGIRLGIKIVPLILFAGNIFLIFYLQNKRIANILKNQPVKQVVALVSVEPANGGRYDRGRIATFEYTVNGKTIKQEEPDDDNQYKSGELYLINYAVNYPEIFRVLKKVEYR